MKNFINYIILIIFVFTTINSKAKTFTVSNNPGIPAQFNNIQAAIDSASSDPLKPDTLYIHKSPNKYVGKAGSIKINKKIVLIGNGHKSINTESSLFSWCGEIYLDGNAQGTVLMGLYLENIYIYGTLTKNIDNLVIRRCRFADGNVFNLSSFNNFNSDNNIVEGCIFSNNQIFLSKCNNTLFSNNVFGDNTTISGGLANTYLFTNNIFTGNSSIIFSNIKNSIIANNIFYNRKLSNIENCTGNSFVNNIIFNTDNDTIIKGLNSISKTISSDPKFKKFNIASNKRFNDYDEIYTYDFSLSPDSPGINQGTDGKNIGLNGSFKLFGTPTLPQITSLLITNTVLNYGTPKGDDIVIKLKATGKK